GRGDAGNKATGTRVICRGDGWWRCEQNVARNRSRVTPRQSTERTLLTKQISGELVSRSILPLMPSAPLSHASVGSTRRCSPRVSQFRTGLWVALRQVRAAPSPSRTSPGCPPASRVERRELAVREAAVPTGQKTPPARSTEDQFTWRVGGSWLDRRRRE